MENDSVTGLERVILVVEYIASASRPPTHTEIASALGIAKSTLSVLLAMLKKTEYVEVIGRRYAPGRRLLALGHKLGAASMVELELRGAMRPTIEAIGRDTGETVTLSVEVGGEDDRPGFVLAIDRVESANRVRVVAGIGEPQRMYDTAAGRVLLAYSGRTAHWLSAHRHLSSGSLPVHQIEQELVLTRERGCALFVNPSVGLVALAVPLFDANDLAVAAVSVIGPVQRMRKDGRDFLPILQEHMRQARGVLLHTARKSARA